MIILIRTWLTKFLKNNDEEPIKQHKEREIRGDLEVKMTYQYPKGKFRFPLIPDEDFSNRSIKEQPSKSISKQEDQSKVNVGKEIQPAFKPTDVPSPIYGYQRQMSSPLSIQGEQDRNENKQIENTNSLHDICKEETKMLNEIKWEENTYNDEDISGNIDAQVQLENKESGDARVQQVDTSFNKEERSAPSQVTENHEEQNSQERATKSRIPYNVVMLKKDRQKKEKNEDGYCFPPLHLLNSPILKIDEDASWINEQVNLLNNTLASFNVRAKVVGTTKGPAVTRFEVQPEPGVKVNKIKSLSDDIKLNLSAKDIRIEAPIPGRNAVGIEVPNQESQAIFLSQIIKDPLFRNHPSPLAAALGVDITGRPVVTDLKKMPHGLIAGATGSGKSVCINAILISLLYKAKPEELKLILIDPKMVELAPYNGLPHLITPVITDVKAATSALKWAVTEMERRYELFAEKGVRDLERYNQVSKEGTLPYLVIIIDELADLMMAAPQDVEEAICRIAQKARACGIHLLLATQRPSVDVITGLIKANIPTRAAFSVSSQVDSRTILDDTGADKLLGKGDMLFLENGSSKAIRLQGNFVSDDEIEKVTTFVKKQMEPKYLFQNQELIQKTEIEEDEDDLFYEACEFVIDQDGASSSSLQRKFRIGYNRAARLIDSMESIGIISETKGSKPRDILVSKEELEELLDFS